MVYSCSRIRYLTNPCKFYGLFLIEILYLILFQQIEDAAEIFKMVMPTIRKLMEQRSQKEFNRPLNINTIRTLDRVEKLTPKLIKLVGAVPAVPAVESNIESPNTNVTSNIRKTYKNLAALRSQKLKIANTTKHATARLTRKKLSNIGIDKNVRGRHDSQSTESQYLADNQSLSQRKNENEEVFPVSQFGANGVVQKVISAHTSSQPRAILENHEYEQKHTSQKNHSSNFQDIIFDIAPKLSVNSLSNSYSTMPRNKDSFGISNQHRKDYSRQHEAEKHKYFTRTNFEITSAGINWPQIRKEEMAYGVNPFIVDSRIPFERVFYDLPGGGHVYKHRHL